MLPLCSARDAQSVDVRRGELVVAPSSGVLVSDECAAKIVNVRVIVYATVLRHAWYDEDGSPKILMLQLSGFDTIFRRYCSRPFNIPTALFLAF